MLYLLAQIWLWLLLAFILGWTSHWLISSNKRKQQLKNNTTHFSAKIEMNESSDG